MRKVTDINIMKDVARMKQWESKREAAEEYRRITGDTRSEVSIINAIEKYAIIKLKRPEGEILNNREIIKLREYVRNPMYDRDIERACRAFKENQRIDVKLADAIKIAKENEFDKFEDRKGMPAGFYKKENLKEVRFKGDYKKGDQVEFNNYLLESGLDKWMSKGCGKIIDEYPRYYLVEMENYKICIDKRDLAKNVYNIKE